MNTAWYLFDIFKNGVPSTSCVDLVPKSEEESMILELKIEILGFYINEYWMRITVNT